MRLSEEQLFLAQGIRMILEAASLPKFALDEWTQELTVQEGNEPSAQTMLKRVERMRQILDEDEDGR